MLAIHQFGKELMMRKIKLVMDRFKCGLDGSMECFKRCKVAALCLCSVGDLQIYFTYVKKSGGLTWAVDLSILWGFNCDFHGP
jgi:hypothetical protein